MPTPLLCNISDISVSCWACTHSTQSDGKRKVLLRSSVFESVIQVWHTHNQTHSSSNIVFFLTHWHLRSAVVVAFMVVAILGDSQTTSANHVSNVLSHCPPPQQQNRNILRTSLTSHLLQKGLCNKRNGMSGVRGRPPLIGSCVAV